MTAPSGPEISRYDIAVEVTLRLLTLMLDVKVWRLMLLIEHPNNDSEER